MQNASLTTRTRLIAALATLGAGAACANTLIPAPVADSPALDPGWEPVKGRFSLNCPLVSVNVSGHECYFALDTGSPATCVDTSWANRAGLKVEEEPKRDGQIVAASSVWGARLDVGGEVLTIKQLHCEPLGHLAASASLPVCGILGFDYFQSHVIRLDYANGVIEMRSPQEFSYTGKGVQLPLLLDYSHVALTLVMVTPPNSEAVGTAALLDTGWNSGVFLSESFAKAAGIDVDKVDLLDDSVYFRGANSGVKHAGHIQTIGIGPLTLHPPDVQVGKPPSDMPMIIGDGVFSDYIVMIDYARSRMILEPNPAAQPQLGIEVDMKLLDSGMRVKRVIPGFLSDRAGLRAGDIVAKWDGKPVVSLTPAEMQDTRERLQREGLPLKLTILRDAQTLEIVIPASAKAATQKP